MRPRLTASPKQRAVSAISARTVAWYAARLGAEDVARHWLRKASALEEGIDLDTLIAACRRRDTDLLGIGADDPDAIERLAQVG